MKKYLIILITIIGLCSFKTYEPIPKKQKIFVKGNVKFPNANDKFGVTLNKRNQDNELTIVKEVKLDAKGNYSFELEVNNPEFYTLDVYKQQNVEFYADDENLTIDFRGVDTAKVKMKNPPHVHIQGGEKNNVLNAIHFASYQNYQYMISIGQGDYKASKSDCKEWQEYTKDSWNTMNDAYDRDIRNIIAMYGNYPTVVKALERLSWKRDKDFMMEHYKMLSKKYPNVPYIQNATANLLAKIENQSKTNIGKVAPDFTFPDINGNNVTLSSLKGKYVLIDFWASWCGPCRSESPNVKEQYKLYKDKGLEVVSVSIDKKMEDWKKAVKEDGTAGILLIAQDSKKLMLEYSFSGIPYMVLLDKEGKIMALNLRGEVLQNKLKEIF